MRKVIFHINDYEYFRRLFYGRFPEASEKQIEESLSHLSLPFKGIFILKGNSYPEYYELYGESGEKLNMDSLNGYQKGIVINDCYRYYEGKLEKPCGVVEIKEEVC